MMISPVRRLFQAMLLYKQELFRIHNILILFGLLRRSVPTVKKFDTCVLKSEDSLVLKGCPFVFKAA